MEHQSRRAFLKFIGTSTLGSASIITFLESCGNFNNNVAISSLSTSLLNRLIDIEIEGISPSDKDDLILAKNLTSKILIKWNTPINLKENFGYNNDFLCFIPLEENNPNDGLLWVNHEYVNTIFVSDYNFRNKVKERTLEQVDKEMAAVGGSIIRVKKEEDNWVFQFNDGYNKRIDATTPIPFNWDEPIKGSLEAIGTHSNCSGGITPWGTILSCEENYDSFYGETIYDKNNTSKHESSVYGWEKFYNYPPEHYGWVVEVDPKTGNAQKHVALGRYAHECCTLKQLNDGRIVAYSGDDANDEFLYKFISTEKNTLKKGTLYVADTINGKWLPLDYNTNPILKEKFASQTEVLIRCREAAKLLGATPQNRPEDIEIDPLTGNILIALTNNKPKGDYHGSILKIIEDNNDYTSLSFKSETFVSGGKETGFSCPDNLIFDYAGNLWFTSDISGGAMNRKDKPYFQFKNNGLFVLIRHGKQKGEIIQVASAPTDAELTGPWFSPDYKTLFLSVQHPGERSKSLNNLTSTWPHDDSKIPKPSVVTIQGDLLDKLNHLSTLESK